jgi:hypothetical protein
MTAKKTMALPDFLTTQEIARARKLYKSAEPGTFAKRCEAEIIKPVIARIDAKLGQKNHPRYLAYACEFVFSQADSKRKE